MVITALRGKPLYCHKTDELTQLSSEQLDLLAADGLEAICVLLVSSLNEVLLCSVTADGDPTAPAQGCRCVHALAKQGRGKSASCCQHHARLCTLLSWRPLVWRLSSCFSRKQAAWVPAHTLPCLWLQSITSKHLFLCTPRTRRHKAGTDHRPLT